MPKKNPPNPPTGGGGKKFTRKKGIVKPKVKKEEDVVAQIEKVEKVERDKRMILWSGVTFFMILIFIFWIYNLKQIFVKVEPNDNSQEFIWSDIAENFTKTIGEVKDNIAEIKDLTNTDEIISTSTDELPSDIEEIEELKRRLIELEGRLSVASTTIATTTSQ